MKLSRLTLLGVSLTVIAVRGALAHSFPADETPAAGATVLAPPQVAIKFDAPIEPLFSQLQVVDASGKDVTAAKPQVDPDNLTLSLNVPPLKPGQYTVKWAVVCIDTHHTNGSYEFVVSGTGS